MPALKIINPTCFPVTVRISTELLDAFMLCEEGSWEDYCNLRKSSDPEDNAEAEEMIFGKKHRYEILGRELQPKRKFSTIEMCDADEVAEVYYGACSGTFQLREEGSRMEGRGYRTAVRICDQLRPILQEPRWEGAYDDMLQRWPAPAGL